MTAEQQNHLVYDILKFTMPDGSPISANVRAGVILSQLGFDDDVRHLRRLLALGIARHDRTFIRRHERQLSKAR